MKEKKEDRGLEKRQKMYRLWSQMRMLLIVPAVSSAGDPQPTTSKTKPTVSQKKLQNRVSMLHSTDNSATSDDNEGHVSSKPKGYRLIDEALSF